MSAPLRADLCVVGAGSGGLSVAAGAAQMGASVVLVERARMGGDCLNAGCVPSKSLIAAARAAHAVRAAGGFGVRAELLGIDGAAVHDHVAGVIAAIAPHDSAERFERLGVRVIRAHARFVSERELEAGGRRVRARRFVVATGSRPRIPPIPGLDAVPYLTNETVFESRTIPSHLVVVGGGPIGVELGQAYCRLGARVSILEQGTILSREDPELVEVVSTALLADGVDLRQGCAIAEVRAASGDIVVRLTGADGDRELRGSHLLIAAGRQPTLDGLDVAAAGIEVTDAGIVVDSRLRTTNRRVFAVGDVVGGPQFTHVAGYHAQIVLRNALFRLPARVDHARVPRVTYCDPELAQVGETHAAAMDRAGNDRVRVLRGLFRDNDRARTDRADEGLVKVVCSSRGRILGAGIVGRGAGELIQPWILALERGMSIGAVASTMLPYPTRGEAGRQAAGSFFTPTLYGLKVRRLVQFLQRFG